MSKIRVGLLIDTFDVPSWVFSMVERIQQGGYAEIVLVVKRNSKEERKKNFFVRLKQNFSTIFFRIYTKFENKFFRTEPDAFTGKSIADFCSNVPLLEVTCIEKKFSDFVSDDDIKKIDSYKVDVFLRLGFRILKGKILQAARYGIWSYHHGDNYLYRGGPAGYWEFLKGDKEVGSVLQILSEDLDGGEVLYRSWSTMETTAVRTINGYYWKTSLFVPRKLKELFETGPDVFFERIKKENNELSFYSDKNYTTPRNATFIKYFVPLVLKRIGHKIWKLFNFEQWVLLYSYNTKPFLSTALYKYKEILPPKDCYWADPFVVSRNDKQYVFFEEVLYNKKKETGHICVAEVGKNGFQSEPVIILKKPYHLSYPFVFEHNSQYYLIPESSENSTIELYEAVNFPYEWEFKMNLMENIRAVDATVLFHSNKVWLFANVSETEGASYLDELFLFSADELLTTNWKPHPQNPIVSDVKSSRPAGKFFTHNDILYRPSQDSSSRYGYGTVINKVLALDENTYKEQKVTAIYPEWKKNVVATHSLSFDGQLTFVDATIKRRKSLFAKKRKQ